MYICAMNKTIKYGNVLADIRITSIYFDNECETIKLIKEIGRSIEVITLTMETAQGMGLINLAVLKDL